MEQYTSFPSLPHFLDESMHDLNRPYVVVHLLDGDSHVGRFLGLGTASREIVMESDDSVVTHIPLGHLRLLEFSDQFQFSANLHESAPSLEGFSITFRSDDTLEGKTYSHKIDSYGVHLYSAVNQGSVERLFIPSESIKDYNFGRADMSVSSGFLWDKIVQNGIACTNKSALSAVLSQQSGFTSSQPGSFTNQRIG